MTTAELERLRQREQQLKRRIAEIQSRQKSADRKQRTARLIRYQMACKIPCGREAANHFFENLLRRRKSWNRKSVESSAVPALVSPKVGSTRWESPALIAKCNELAANGAAEPL